MKCTSDMSYKMPIRSVVLPSYSICIKQDGMKYISDISYEMPICSVVLPSDSKCLKKDGMKYISDMSYKMPICSVDLPSYSTCLKLRPPPSVCCKRDKRLETDLDTSAPTDTYTGPSQLSRSQYALSYNL